MMPALRLPRALADELLRLARQCPSEEICGLISGDADGLKRLYPIANIAADRTRFFELDPKSQIEAMRDMRDRGEELSAIYHSHPHGPALPSAEDIARHAYPEAAYLIIAPAATDGKILRGFRIAAGGIDELILAG